jgi:hypothetical protein
MPIELLTYDAAQIAAHLAVLRTILPGKGLGAFATKLYVHPDGTFEKMQSGLKTAGYVRQCEHLEENDPSGSGRTHAAAGEGSRHQTRSPPRYSSARAAVACDAITGSSSGDA